MTKDKIKMAPGIVIGGRLCWLQQAATLAAVVNRPCLTRPLSPGASELGHAA
jgi:hypothetical protein